MNPGLISCHYTVEESFVTFVTLILLRTSFKTGLLVDVHKLSSNLSAQAYAKPCYPHNYCSTCMAYSKKVINSDSAMFSDQLLDPCSVSRFNC